MRTIKFRAWTPDSVMIYDIEYSNGKFYAGQGVTNVSMMEGCEVYDVMQYTGLKDKNGKEIYEGDVCGHLNLSIDPKNEDSCVFAVLFEDGSFRKGYEGWDTTLDKPLLSSRAVDILGIGIIGNIYENPELMKGKDA